MNRRRPRVCHPNSTSVYKFKEMYPKFTCSRCVNRDTNHWKQQQARIFLFCRCVLLFYFQNISQFIYKMTRDYSEILSKAIFAITSHACTSRQPCLFIDRCLLSRKSIFFIEDFFLKIFSLRKNELVENRVLNFSYSQTFTL